MDQIIPRQRIAQQAELPIQDLDSELEHEIRQAGEEIERHMARYRVTNAFEDRADADRARLRMQELIKRRRPGFVAQLERERGLA